MVHLADLDNGEIIVSTNALGRGIHFEYGR